LTLPRISTTRAANQHLAWCRQKPLSPYMQMMRRATIRRFSESLFSGWMDEIAPAHTDIWLDSHPTASAKFQASKHLRAFLEWSNIRFGMALYIPEIRRCGYTLGLRHRAADHTLEWEERGLAVGRRMTLPHQRLVFLLGFIWGWNLRRVQTATRDDLFAVAPMRDDLYHLAEVVSQASPLSGPALKRWMGLSARNGRRAWAAWSGGAKFWEIIKAGRCAKQRRGIRPDPVLRASADVVWALPAMDGESVKKMPRVWEGEP